MLVEGSDKGPEKDSPIGDGVVSPEDRDIPAAITDTGCERELNEDRYAVIECPSGLAWLVCDGMGGVTGGELAAQLAIDGIRRDLESLPDRQPTVAIKNAILEANRIIVLRRQNPAFAQMGTTIVAALFSGAEVALAHVGDSRAYLIRDGQIEQLTTDHTYVQELVDKGQIKPEEALSHPQAHILTRAIGSEPGLEVEVSRYWIWPLAEGAVSDFLVMCSDGLYSHVSDDEIAQIIEEKSPQRACVELVELAKARGGYDNITLAVIPIGGQLRVKAPEGAEEQRGMQRAAKQKKSESSGGGTALIVKQLVYMSVLTVLSILLVALGMGFYLSR